MVVKVKEKRVQEKARKTKVEILKSTLCLYLKRRQYNEAAAIFSSDVPYRLDGKFLSQGDLAVIFIVEKYSTRKGYLSFRCLNNDMAQVDQQFIRLTSWIAELKQEIIKSELASLLCPIFCHLYLEMLIGNHRGPANKFFKRHLPHFSNREHNRELLAHLGSITNIQDLETNGAIRLFRSCKYHVKLSGKAVQALQRYLKAHANANIILVEIIHAWIDLEVADSRLYFNHVKTLEPELDIVKSEGSEDVTDITVPDYYPSPILVYSVHNPQNMVCCGKLSSSNDILAIGMGSTIKLTSITGRPLGRTRKPQSVYRSSTIYGSCTQDIKNEHAYEVRNNHSYASSACSSGRMPTVSLYGHSKQVQDFYFIEDRDHSQHYLLSASLDRTLKLWNLEDNSCVLSYRGHTRPIWCITGSVYGAFLATGSADKSAKLWSLDRAYPLRSFLGHYLDIECAAFHPNCMYLATGSSDKSIRLWSLTEARCVRLLASHKGAVQAIQFSPDGRYLASAGEDKRIKIWDLQNSCVIMEYRGHTCEIMSLAWCPDGSHIASCSQDKTVRVWRFDTSGVPKIINANNKPCDDVTTYTVGAGPMLRVQYANANAVVCIKVHNWKKSSCW